MLTIAMTQKVGFWTKDPFAQNLHLCRSYRQPFGSKTYFHIIAIVNYWFRNLYLCHSYRQPLVQNYFCRIVIVYSVFIHKLTFVSQLSSTFWFKYLLMCHSYCQSLIQKLLIQKYFLEQKLTTAMMLKYVFGTKVDDSYDAKVRFWTKG
jgi:hypothetical protein